MDSVLFPGGHKLSEIIQQKDTMIVTFMQV